MTETRQTPPSPPPALQAATESLEAGLAQLQLLGQECANARNRILSLTRRCRELENQASSQGLELEKLRTHREDESRKLAATAARLQAALKELDAQRTATAQAHESATTEKAAHAKAVASLETRIRRAVEEAGSRERQLSERHAKEKAEAARRGDQALRQATHEADETIRGLRELVEKERAAYAARERQLIASWKQDIARRQQALLESNTRHEAEAAKLRTSLEDTRKELETATRNALTESDARRKLQQELERVRRLYPLRDLIQEKDQQLRELETVLKLVPSPQEGQVRGLIDTVRTQRRALEASLQAARREIEAQT